MPTQSPDTNFVVIGKIGTPYGVKGWVKILSFTDSIDQILEYDPWYLEDESGWRQIDVIDRRAYGIGIIAQLAGFENPEQSRLLTGLKIAIESSQLAALQKDEYYWRDLEGLTVINHDGRILGKVISLMETGANDVLIVRNEKEIAIPYIKGVVLSVDIAKQEMRVKWDFE